MKNNKNLLLILISALALSAVMCTSASSGEPEGEPLTAGLNEISGTVQMLKQETGALEDASNGALIENGDQVVTHADSRVRVDISDGTIIRVGPLSSFTLSQMANQDGHLDGHFKLDIGSIWIILHGGEVKVDTPSGLASVRGSYLFIYVNPGEKNTFVTCLEGECELSNDVGKIKMVAGQTATVINSKAIPQLGRMSPEDVADWLKNNPEATEVIIPLTKTVEARGNNGNGNGGNSDKGQDDNNEALATATVTKTPVPPTATKTSTAIDCGPPLSWILHTLAEDEDIETLAEAFQVDVTAIQKANCMGESTSTVQGMTLYMPDVATITPTPTMTNTPTKTPVPATATNTAVPATNTNTAVPAAATATVVPTATNSPTTFQYSAGPDGKTLAPGQCFNTYTATVLDADGIQEVKVWYSYTDSNSTKRNGYLLLPNIGGDNYSATLHIPTDVDGSDFVTWRFEAWDIYGIKTIDSNIYSYNDPQDCGATSSIVPTDIPTPSIGYPITDSGSCSQSYYVDVADPDEVKKVWIQYSEASTFTNPQYITSFTKQTGTVYSGIWGGVDSVDTSTFASPSSGTIYWRFKIEDGLGDIAYYPSGSTYTFVYSVACP